MTAGLGRQGALVIMKRLAKQKAADEESLEDYEGDGEDWINQIFYSTELGGKAIDVWSNIPQASVIGTSDSFYCSRAELKGATADYVNRMAWLHCREFNWLLANLLLYAEVSATASAFGAGWMWEKGKLRFKWIVFRAVIALGVWGIWLAIPVGLLVAELPWVAGGWVVLTALRQGLLWRARRIRGQLLASMISTYESTNTMDLSWTVVWELLTRSRDLGAVWDQELYQLVENLKKA